jgi:purine nucleosidase
MNQRSAAWYEERLRVPSGVVQLVIDTDAANEIDDQFALAWAMAHPEKLHIHGIYATPFSFRHRRSLYPAAPADALPFCSPEDGMQRSLSEILKIQELLGGSKRAPVLAGSSDYLHSLERPQSSDAAEHLIALAKRMSSDEPLYVVAIGCATNIANALLLAPEIAQSIVVVWTSAFPSHAPHANRSFNLEQDVLASQTLFDSGVPLVYLPGFHVGAQLRLSWAEVQRFVGPHGPVGAYLQTLFSNNPLWVLTGKPCTSAHSWVIWDLINIAWLLSPDWVSTNLVDTPRLGPDLHWHRRVNPFPMREAYAVNRDAIFNDLFASLQAIA